MTTEGTQLGHLDFLHWERDESSSEIHQFGHLKGGMSDEMHLILNRAARDIDGCIGVGHVRDMGMQVNFILLIDKIEDDEHGTADEKIKALRMLFTQRVDTKKQEYLPLTADRVEAGTAIHSDNAERDKLEARRR